MAGPFPWRVLWVFVVIWGCVSQTPDDQHFDRRPFASQTIQGSWAVAVNQAGGIVTRNGQIMKIDLAVEDFSDADFDRFGYWNQSGFYEHSYGGDGVGSFLYHFAAIPQPLQSLEVTARLSAESQGVGAPEDKSEVSLLINGMDLGSNLVKADDMKGEIYRWYTDNPQLLSQLKLKNAPENELRFVVKENAKHQHGLCIYGKSLDAAGAGQGVRITLRMAEGDLKKQRLSQRGEEL